MTYKHFAERERWQKWPATLAPYMWKRKRYSVFTSTHCRWRKKVYVVIGNIWRNIFHSSKPYFKVNTNYKTDLHKSGAGAVKHYCVWNKKIWTESPQAAQT